jgi:hypothetical protein
MAATEGWGNTRRMEGPYSLARSEGGEPPGQGSGIRVPSGDLAPGRSGLGLGPAAEPVPASVKSTRQPGIGAAQRGFGRWTPTMDEKPSPRCPDRRPVVR